MADAEIVVAGAILGGWDIRRPCGESEFLFPAIGSIYSGLREMSRDERENLDRWLVVEIRIDLALGISRVDDLIVEVEAASHEPRDVVEAAVAAVHGRFLRDRFADLIAELGCMADEDRRIGRTIGYAGKALDTIRAIEHVRIIAPTSEWRVGRYTRRIEAAQADQVGRQAAA